MPLASLPAAMASSARFAFSRQCGNGSPLTPVLKHTYRRWPRPMPRIPALRRSAPTVRFIDFETFTTRVLAFECVFSSRTSSFVHGFGTRCDTIFAMN